MEDRYVAYAGSYTRGESEGIYIMDLDMTGRPSFKIRDAFRINNPSHMQISADGKFLYTCFDGGVAALRILEDGGLEMMNTASVNGLRPAAICVDKENRFLLSGGYHDGKLTVVKIHKSGKVGEVCDEVFMKGLGSVGARHYHSHISSVRFTPDEKYAIAVDLGMDLATIFAINRETGKLKRHSVIRCDLESGPRDLVFSHNGKFAYLLHEYGNYVTQYAYEAEGAVFMPIQKFSTLPPDYKNYNSAIRLELSDDDKHLFACNSGNNSVAIYEIEPESGQMQHLCVLPVSGEFPCDTLLLPDGIHFASVNQESSSITSFKINYENGFFVMDGKPVDLPSPTCIRLHKLS